MFLFEALAIASAVGVPAYVWQVRGRTFAIFSGVMLAVALPGAVVTHVRLVALLPELAPVLHVAFAGGVVAATLQLTHLARARLRGPVFRLGVSIPGQAFLAAGALSGVWLLALLPPRALLSWLGLPGALAALAWLDLLPPLVAVLSIATSLVSRREVVRIRLGREGPEELTRVPVERHRGRAPEPLPHRPLRIVQITDPHLGPWQSVRELAREIESLLAREPDLVLLTGDYLTMESRGSAGALAEALRPLAAYSGRCFASLGNHDLEAPEEVRAALASNDVTLLVDAVRRVETPAGPVCILGADYVGRGRREHLGSLAARYPRREGDGVRVLLLHDPAAFRAVPEGFADLTLSGHTHGGQAGLVLFGLDWTVLSGTRWPDHGLFARGRSRLYVHRGTGFYGFPLRLGVPGESSLLEVVVP